MRESEIPERASDIIEESIFIQCNIINWLREVNKQTAVHLTFDVRVKTALRTENGLIELLHTTYNDKRLVSDFAIVLRLGQTSKGDRGSCVRRASTRRVIVC